MRDSSTDLILKARSLLAAILVVLICDFTSLHLSFEAREGLASPKSYSEVITEGSCGTIIIAHRVETNSKRRSRRLMDFEIISRAHIWPLNVGAWILRYRKLWGSWRSLRKNEDGWKAELLLSATLIFLACKYGKLVWDENSNWFP